MNILDVECSMFENARSTSPRTTNLYDWLTAAPVPELSRRLESLRIERDEETRKELKKGLPAITPSGIFRRRNAAEIVQHTGLICIDIDRKDNTHLSDEAFRGHVNRFRECREVAYCGFSASGNGYFALIPIAEPSRHVDHFLQLERLIKDLFDIVIDKGCKDVTRLRFYSYDPDAYINPQASPLPLVMVPAQPKKQLNDCRGINRPGRARARHRGGSDIDRLMNAIDRDITNDYSTEWLRIGFALANEFGESGRGYFHHISSFSHKYDAHHCDRQYTHCLRQNYSGRPAKIGTLFRIAQQYGVRYRKR